MIRTIVLVGLLAVMFYCAFAGPAHANEIAAATASVANAAPAVARAQRQFIPGSMAALHWPSQDLAVSMRTAGAVPNA